MPYSELVKNFDLIRDYLREFYIYGFKSRDGYDMKSSRSYDDARRKIESWLGDNMSFKTTKDGKITFISIDSRREETNPFFKAWMSKSFTSKDITIHFYLLEIMGDNEEHTLKEICEKMESFGDSFDEPFEFDISTVRKKLGEYIDEGMFSMRKEGRTSYYRAIPMTDLPTGDALSFFSETAPCGVIGHFLLNKRHRSKSNLRFKHHYITSVMDSEILCMLIDAMHKKESIILTSLSKHKKVEVTNEVIPLKVMNGSQNGKQHLLCCEYDSGRFVSLRIDNILKIEAGRPVDYFDEARVKLDSILEHVWGVSLGKTLEHVEFDIRFTEFEDYVYFRLKRERRIGKITLLEKGLVRFEADVYDSMELIPWMRTYIGRITRVYFSNSDVQKRFTEDIRAMARLYGGTENDI